jgi:hypothetical protein
MKEIPVVAGQRIAEEYGYDQVVIIARKVGGGEHVTTYGIDPANCAAAAQIGNFLKHKVMGWPLAEDDTALARRALNEWFGGRENWPPVHKLDALIASVAHEARMGKPP